MKETIFITKKFNIYSTSFEFQVDHWLNSFEELSILSYVSIGDKYIVITISTWKK